MAKTDKTNFVCTECGYDAPKWSGKCPSCGVWGSMKEFKQSATKSRMILTGTEKKCRPELLKDIRSFENSRTLSAID